MIEFHLDGRSGVSSYLQFVHQVRQAMRLGDESIEALFMTTFRAATQEDIA